MITSPHPCHVPGLPGRWRYFSVVPVVPRSRSCCSLRDSFSTSSGCWLATLSDSHRNDAKQIYVKCVPLHWPLDNVPGECTYECWFELEGAAVQARCRLVNNRPDRTQYPARNQEYPALYTNGPWYRLMTYTGDQPFTGGELSRIEKRPGEGQRR